MTDIVNGTGKLKVIISDGNRINQSFFKKFETVENKPWISLGGSYLLYDFVHLMKNIRNLWLTEKTGTFDFPHDGKILVAKWQDLCDLYKDESKYTKLLKMLNLTEVSVYPKPIERQRVSTCLYVFSEKTATALELYGKRHGLDVLGTVIFIRKVVKWSTILNVKNRGIDVRKRQPLQAVISDPEDPRLYFLLEFGKMCLNMRGKQGKRVKQLSKDTADAVHHTCCGIVELAKNLLTEEGFDYVCLGELSTDRLEKASGKLRQDSGGAYFINAQQVSEKLRLSQAKLHLKQNCELNISNESVKHMCNDCDYVLNAEASDAFDNLSDLETSVPDETKSNLVHIAGYVTRKSSNESEIEDTYHYFEKYGEYSASLDRGGLNTPGDVVCQWTIFGLIIFDSIKYSVCRTSLTRTLLHISDAHGFDIQQAHCFTLANIFLNNLCKASNPLLRKEVKQKLVKLL